MPRRALFDLAVNRALSYALSTRLDLQEAELEAIHSGLELWYLKTRFAYRIPLDAVIQALVSYPGGEYTWQGGEQGHWVTDRPTS